VTFAQPFAIHVQKRCRSCRQLVRVTLLNGASEPTDVFFRCSDCLNTPEASDAALEREQRPQLRLIGGQADG